MLATAHIPKHIDDKALPTLGWFLKIHKQKPFTNIVTTAAGTIRSIIGP